MNTIMTKNTDFSFHIIKKKGKCSLYSSRNLQPMEIMEVTANVVGLVPSDMREMVLDIIQQVIIDKEEKVLV